jgi:tetratricopeptide (TPR) repeat protein
MSQRIHRTIFSSFAGLACFLCCVGFGQLQGETSIGGTVRSEENDSPIPQVRVELRTVTGIVVHPIVLTNDRGEFQFGPFGGGVYDVIAELDGYESARIQVDITLHPEIDITIRLHKLSNTAPAGDVTTAHQLSIPQKAHDAFDKGMAKAHSKADYLGAIEEFQRAIKNYPDYYESYAEMGLAHVRLKDFPSAEKDLRKSIELSSAKYAPPLMLLSMLLNDQNRSADAELVAHQAIAAKPKTWRGHYELGRALFSQQRVAEAEAAASTARDLKPENPDVYLLLSEIHRSTHNAPALLQDVDTYLKLAPQGPAAPQVRKLREQLVKYMDAQPKPVAQP